MAHHSLQFYDYHMWANKRVFERLKELPEGTYQQETQSVFSSLAEVVLHLYLTDLVWLGALADESFQDIQSVNQEASERLKNSSLNELETEYIALSDRYYSFFSGRKDLDEKIIRNHPAFGSVETTLAELLQHVVNHGTYHRGNITAMMRQLGHPGPSTDYVYYLYAIQDKN
ncbi:DinB family protein [Cytobacillus purgationiresistens]|uniref:Damage-inducible protein DinB n=1 Tax=Cytobacillus purgationiresistens TaxID=863449 RepID=A0ABU0AKJ8_9BACI|nr:DinB family protein [Cytobacillus purgationiresistens]MDQ0270903.1 putative damage-inducible protein DinB [Cytobacillus purgationiresistens]